MSTLQEEPGHYLESKLHIYYLELKAVFLALKEFKNICSDKTVLVATDNTTVVSYINKEGGMRLGTLCALLWRILTWCTRNQVTLKARHISGRLNVVADKLSRLGQTIQTEWSLLPAVFQAICNRWHQPQIDLFATRFNNKLPQFVSPVPDTMATAVDAAILGKVVEKLQDTPYTRFILVAPGWPNMPWFWALVEMSSQIPLSLPLLPNLLTQPFNQIPHRNLANLNLHAWLLKPQQSRSKGSLRTWQQELRHLKGDQPDRSMRQSGPFLQSGASLIRWTSSAIADKLGNSTFYCVNTSYLVDRCICPAPCRSRQTLEKNVLSWALAGTGSVLFICQVAV